MSDQVFVLKRGDTKPKLIATLENPDKTLHDLTGITNLKLHIRLQGGTTVLTRSLNVEGAPTNAQVSYQWQTTDWDTANLVVGTHEMEIESVSERLTFPNDRNLRLHIAQDIGQG